MDACDKDLNLILTADTTGVIACMIAEHTGMRPYDAFRNFYKSETYRLFRNPDSFVNNWGPGPVTAAYLREISSLDPISINVLQ